MNRELEQIQNLLNKKKIEEAEKYFREKEMEFCTENLILQQIFEISKLEKKQGLSNIFDHSIFLNELFWYYKKVKLLIMRYEFDAYIEGELNTFVQENQTSWVMIFMIVLTCAVDRQEVVSRLANEFFQGGNLEYALQLLLLATASGLSNDEIVYNIAYILYALGRGEEALGFLDQVQDDRIPTEWLRQEIQEGRNNHEQ